MHLAKRERQPRPLVIVEPTGTHPVGIDFADRGQHTHGQLRATHFHREHGHRQTDLDCHMLAHIQRKRGFTHRRTTGNDDQIPWLQAGGSSVEIMVPSRYPGNVGGIVTVVQFLNAFDHLGEQGIDVLKAGLAAKATLGNGKHLGLGLIKQLFWVAAKRRECITGNFIAGSHQLAQNGSVAHDLGITPDVRRRGGICSQFAQVSESAGIARLACMIQAFSDRDHISGFAALQQAPDLAKNPGMLVAVEILFTEQVGDLVERSVVQQQAAKHRLFRLHRMRRNAQLRDRRIIRRGKGAAP